MLLLFLCAGILVFYRHLLFLLLLYLYVVAISCLFEIIGITSDQRSTGLVLTLRGLLILLLRAFYISVPFLCFSDLRCKFDDWFLCGIGVGMEKVK